MRVIFAKIIGLKLGCPDYYIVLWQNKRRLKATDITFYIDISVYIFLIILKLDNFIFPEISEFSILLCQFIFYEYKEFINVEMHGSKTSKRTSKALDKS